MDRPEGPTDRQGFTLLEMGFVIGVAGIIILFTASLSSTQHKLQDSEHRADGVVQDVLDIIDVTWAWSTTNSTTTAWHWPYYPSTTTISINKLKDDNYIKRLPTTRYPEICEPLNTCSNDWDYKLTGWDRDSGTTATAKVTDNAANADDLIVQFRIAEEPRVRDAIIARIPYGRLTNTTTHSSGTIFYDIEARLLQDNSPIATGSQFVTWKAPTRDIKFDEGDLQGVSWLGRETPDRAIPGDAPGTILSIQGASGGEVLAMIEGGVQIGTWNDKTQWTSKNKVVSGYMEVKSESDEATMGARTELYLQAPPTSSSYLMHETKIGVSGGVPIWETIGNQGAAATTTDPERRFRLEYKKGNQSWDMYFANQLTGHKSLQCRLCKLERLLDTYKADMSDGHASDPNLVDLTLNTYTDDSCSSFTASDC